MKEFDLNNRISSINKANEVVASSQLANMYAVIQQTNVKFDTLLAQLVERQKASDTK